MRYGWSVSYQDWDGARDLLQSRRWRKIKLNRQVAHTPPAKPGVYLMCTNIPQRMRSESKFVNGIYNVIYVGSTLNLENRFKQHAAGDRPNVVEAQRIFGQIDFMYLELPGSSRGDVEAAEGLIGNVFGPVANDRLPIKAKLGNEEPLTSSPKK